MLTHTWRIRLIPWTPRCLHARLSSWRCQAPRPHSRNTIFLPLCQASTNSNIGDRRAGHPNGVTHTLPHLKITAHASGSWRPHRAGKSRESTTTGTSSVSSGSTLAWTAPDELTSAVVNDAQRDLPPFGSPVIFIISYHRACPLEVSGPNFCFAWTRLS